MRTDRIDFISAYCDRWCERCAFTSRCSAFAANAAIAMCGDAREGLELALGVPRAAEPDAAPPGPPEWLRDFDQTPPSEEEMAQWRKEEDARDARVDATAAMKLAEAYSRLAWRWLEAEQETWGPSTDPIVREALEVISWDHILISAKINRALSSREQPFDDDPIQNDANGSAKVALISIERSEASWRVVAQATGGELPLMMADHLAQLRAEVELEFPDARRFRRPGFDDERADG
jgi:hypothetical protein